jgi:DNA ligase-1
MSEKSLLKALSNITSDDVQKKRDELGDIGDTVMEFVLNESSNLEITEIYESLWKVINNTGTGSVIAKANIVVSIFTKLSAIESKYFSRIVCGTLRLGSSVKTLLDSFSFILSQSKESREKLDYAYGVCADIGYIAKTVLKNKKIEDVEIIKPAPGIPVLSRLVERSKSFEELQERMGDKYIIQPKFDGLRLQIHKSSDNFINTYSDRIWFKYLPKEVNTSMFSQSVDSVKLFTRNLEDVTKMFPEIVSSAINLKCDSCILDGEVVGWNEKMNTFMTYQETMTRKRKYGIDKSSDQVPVKTFVFDILFLNGYELVSTDTIERSNIVKELLKDSKSDIVLSESLVVGNVTDLETNFNRWVEEGLEGLIAKQLTGEYTPGGRNFEWIKLKKSFMTKLSDSIDTVILGYYFGSGKRAQYGIGALLCGVYNPEKEIFESVTKLGTGITDAQLSQIKDRLDTLISKEKPKNVSIDPMLKPDVWVYPEVVCTIEADDITKSIQKGEVLAGGLSLRFPRMIEFDREKLPNEATTVSELIEMAQK